MNESNFKFNFRKAKTLIPPATLSAASAETSVMSAAERILAMFDYYAGQEFRLSSIIETVSLAGGSAALSTQLPANARVLYGGIYNTSAITYSGSALNLGIGLSGAASNASAFYLDNGETGIGSTHIKPTPEVTSRIGGTVAATLYVVACSAAGTNLGTGTVTANAVIIFEYAQNPIA